MKARIEDERKVIYRKHIKISYSKIKKNESKKALIFLHGLGGNSTSWDRIRVHISHLNINSYAVDLRGHGFSGRPKAVDAYSLSNIASDINRLIEYESISSYILIGHCFGGMVATFLASQDDPKMCGLVLVNSCKNPPPYARWIRYLSPMEKFIKRTAEYIPNIGSEGRADYTRFINTGDWDLRRILVDINHTTLKPYILLLRTAVAFDATSMLHSIKVPTLILSGEKDTIFPQYQAESLQRDIKNSNIEYIKDANHIMIWNHSRDVAERLKEFLSEVNL